MKKVVFIVLMAMCVSIIVVGFAQNNESRKNYIYCELIGQEKVLSNKVKIQVDFGQKTSFWKGGADKMMKDNNGKAIEFNSLVDAMNYFGAQGWELVQAFAVTEPTGLNGQQNVYHWILKKEITAAEAKEVEDEIKS